MDWGWGLPSKHDRTITLLPENTTNADDSKICNVKSTKHYRLTNDKVNTNTNKFHSPALEGVKLAHHFDE